MRRVLVSVLTVVVVAQGCSPTGQPGATHSLGHAASTFSDDELISGLRYRTPEGDTLLETVPQHRAVDVLGLQVLGEAAGIVEAPAIVRADAARASTDILGSSSPRWSDAFAFAVAAAHSSGEITSAMVGKILRRLSTPTSTDLLWAALLRQQGYSPPHVPGVDCAHSASAAQRDPGNSWVRQFDAYVATHALANCPTLGHLLEQRIVEEQPTLQSLARACLAEGCAGQQTSIEHFLSDAFGRLGGQDLEQWGASGASDYALLGVLIMRLDVHVTANSTMRDRIDSLSRIGGIPAGESVPSDLGLLLSAIMLSEAHVTPAVDTAGTRRSVTAQYALGLDAHDVSTPIEQIERRRTWTPQDWFVMGLEHLRSGSCPSGIGDAQRRQALSLFARYPRSSSIQMAALADRMLRQCHAAPVPGLTATVVRLARTVVRYELSGREALHLQLVWSANNALCFTGQGGEDDARLVAAAQRYLANLRTTGLDYWDLGEYFAARRLAAGAGCHSASWFSA